MRSTLCWLSGSSSREWWEVEILVPGFLNARNLKVVVPQLFYLELGMDAECGIQISSLCDLNKISNEIIMRT